MTVDSKTARYYTDRAAHYIATTEKLKILRLWGLALQYFNENGRILDLGSGSGRDLKFFTELGYRCTGFDYSKALARHAKKHSSASVVIGDFHYLPFGDNTFDGVWAIASLLHVHKSCINSVLQQIYNCLVFGGIFISSIKTGETADRDSTGRLYTKYTKETWRQQLIHANFLLVDNFEDGVWINSVATKPVIML